MAHIRDKIGPKFIGIMRSRHIVENKDDAARLALPVRTVVELVERTDAERVQRPAGEIERQA